MIVFGVLSGGNDLIEVVAVGSMERRAHIVLCPSSGCQALAGDITDNADLYLVASIMDLPVNAINSGTCHKFSYLGLRRRIAHGRESAQSYLLRPA